MNYSIFLDMDEVIVDFTRGAYDAFELTAQEVERYRTPGDWSIVDAIGKTLGVPLSNSDFWMTIAASETNESLFWRNLKPLPWIDELIEVIAMYDPDFMFCSTPSYNPNSWSGKMEWIKDYIPAAYSRVVLTQTKYKLAGPGKILIDDREKTIERWQDNGGIGILFPSKGNNLHPVAEQQLQVDYVTNRLESIITGGIK